MGLEHLGTSVSPEMATEDGQPEATLTISDLPEIKFRIVSKPVSSTFGSVKRYTYFFAYLSVGGEEIRPNTAWSKTPTEAIETSLDWWVTQLKQKIPYSGDMFADLHPLHESHFQGYWIIDGTHEEATT